jgi:hypothetical protein
MSEQNDNTYSCSTCGNVFTEDYGIKEKVRTACERCFAPCSRGDKVRFAAPHRDSFNWGHAGLEKGRIYTVTKMRQYHHGRGVWVDGVDKEFHSMIFVPADCDVES